MFANNLTMVLNREEAFKEIYAAHYRKVVFYAYNYLKDKELAESIAQDVFLVLWEQMDKLDESGEVLPYLFTLAKFRCLNWLRRTKHHDKYAKEKLTVADISIAALNDSATSDIYSKEITSIIGKAMDKMPEKVRETFVFSRFKELKNREIAVQQNISEKAVEYRISCAFKILRKMLKDYTFVSIFMLLLCGFMEI